MIYWNTYTDEQKQAAMQRRKGMANPILDFEKLKPILLGEFKFPVEQSCSACYFNEPQEECEIYAGEVTFTENVHVPCPGRLPPRLERDIDGRPAAHHVGLSRGRRGRRRDRHDPGRAPP